MAIEIVDSPTKNGDFQQLFFTVRSAILGPRSSDLEKTSPGTFAASHGLSIRR